MRKLAKSTARKEYKKICENYAWMKRICRPQEYGVSFSKTSNHESNRADPSDAALHSALILHPSVPMTNARMLKRADFRPSDGFMPADENRHLPPRSSTPMLSCNARCWTTIEGGKDKGLILPMVPSRSYKAHLQIRVGWSAVGAGGLPLLRRACWRTKRSRQIASSTSIACVF